MMAVHQSPLVDVQRLITRPTFDAKEVTRIGTWNVRTLFQSGKTAQLLREFDTYRMDILGISEMRWTGSGRFVSDGKLVIFSGNDTKHMRGVGIVFSKRTSAAIIRWKPVSDRIISARLQGRYGRITIIQAYAPIDMTSFCCSEISTQKSTTIVKDLNMSSAPVDRPLERPTTATD